MGINIDVLLTEIEIVYRHLKELSYPDSSLSGQGCSSVFGKDDSRATEYRNEGNVMYRRRDDRQALKWYTECVAQATESGEELALAYANRSAALFRLDECVPCLLDINRVLKRASYPKHLRKKLEDRKEMCLAKMAEKGVKIVCDDDEVDPIESTATSCSSNVAEDNFNNTLLPKTSSKIELACDEVWGRHMVAAKDIEPGEILSCEQFFITFPCSNLERIRCSYCLVKCAALIPCPSCSQRMYCSESCRTRAFNAYHRTECRMLPFFEHEGPDRVECANEALRMLFVGTEQGANLRRLTARLGIRNLFTEKVNPVNKLYKSDYQSILQIRRTFDQPSKASVLVAVKAIIWLQRISFFENHPDPNSMSETEIFATLALLNHLQSVYFHGFCISETVHCDSNLSYVVGSANNIIGYGMIALQNLVNHSCNPNAGYIYARGREQMIFSVRPIKRGEQVFVAYCPSFAETPSTERKRKLVSFGFACYCEACTNDWPLYTALTYEKPKFVYDVKIIVEIRTAILRTIQDRSVKDTNIRDLIRCSKLIHDYLQSPSYFAIVCEDMLSKYMAWTYSELCYTNDNPVAEQGESVIALEEQIFTMLFKNLST